MYDCLRIIRSYLLCLIAVFCCALMSFSAAAGEAKINFTDQSVDDGDIVIIFMKIRSEDGTVIEDADITLSYPVDLLEFISGTDAAGGDGSIRVDGASYGGGSEIAEYHLAFRTLNPGTAGINVESAEVYDDAAQVIDLTHIGNSVVTIVPPDEGTANDTETLSAESSPGETPAADISLAQAHASGTDSEGESAGSEAGIFVDPEAPRLSSSAFTITVLEPGEDVAPPAELEKASALIDDQLVTAWYAPSDEAEYCVFYGMNEDGDTGFYRYDFSDSEKTLQRFFAVSLSEAGTKNSSHFASTVLIILLTIAAAALLALAIHLYLDISRLKARGRHAVHERHAPHEQSDRVS